VAAEISGDVWVARAVVGVAVAVPVDFPPGGHC